MANFVLWVGATADWVNVLHFQLTVLFVRKESRLTDHLLSLLLVQFLKQFTLFFYKFTRMLLEHFLFL